MDPEVFSDDEKEVVDTTPNFFKKGSTVAITLTTDPYIVSQVKVKAQHACAYKIILDLFKNIGDLMLYPELTKKGQIHYHGTLFIRDHIKLYKSVARINRELGFVYMSRITDAVGKEDHCESTEKWQVKKKVLQKRFPTWGSYIIKDKELMEELLEIKLPLITKDDTSGMLMKKKQLEAKRKAYQKELDHGILEDWVIKPVSSSSPMSDDF